MTDFYIITPANNTDYSLGFEVQSPEKEFVSWDTTYNEMIALPYVEAEFILDTDFEVSDRFFFKYPVRIGNVIIPRLGFYLNYTDRSDIAVFEYSYEKKNSDENEPLFLDLCRQLEQDLTTERFDHERAWFMAEEISFRVYYFQGNGMYLYITNTREYPHLLIDTEYEQRMEITDFIAFPKNEFSFELNYKRDQRVKRCPPILAKKFAQKSVFWRDDTNGKLGFSTAEFSVNFDIKDIKSVEIHRVFPAKGGGGDFLHLHLENEKYS